MLRHIVKIKKKYLELKIWKDVFMGYSGQRPPKPGEDLAMRDLLNKKSPPALKLWRAKVGPAGHDLSLCISFNFFKML
jgi:hypothetical protein